jgi:hypothetical protein
VNNDARIRRGYAPTMTTATSSSFSVRRQWLFGRYATTYEVSLHSDLISLSKVINGFVQLILPIIYSPSTHSHPSDIKGRDSAECLLPELPQPLQDEVLRVGGRIAGGDNIINFDWEPFDISCSSHFEGFSDSGGILYSARTNRSHTIPSWLPLRLIGAAAPIQPTFFRFGCEHFRPVRTFASLGSAPQVTESLLIDCSESACAVRIIIESRNPVSRELLDSTPCIKPSTHLLASIYGYDIMKDILQRVSSEAAY